MYAVDERAVAEAIVIRARLRATIARPTLVNERREVEVRSFRRDPRARSFQAAPNLVQLGAGTSHLRERGFDPCEARDPAA